MSFTEHINKMCKKDSYATSLIGRIRKKLPLDGLKMLVNPLVISRLDYCNSLSWDIPKYRRNKLRRIQNTAARMITEAFSSDDITHIFKSLHWLPVEARVNFKILLITYKILMDNLLDIWNLVLRNITHQEHYDHHTVRNCAPQP